MKKLFIVFISLFLLFSCNNTAEKTNTSEKAEVVKNEVNKEELKIISPIIPISSIINYIWWDYVSVENIVWAGVSPHTFSLSIAQMTKIEKSDLVINLWLEHIDWFLDKAIAWKDILKLSEWINMIDLSEEDEHDHEEDNHEDDEHKDEHNDHDEEEHHEEEGHDEHWEEKDPHVWNSFDNSKILAEKISKKLTELKPEYKDAFEENLLSFNKELDDLKNNFEEKVKWKKETKFIIFHNAYNYLFRDLGIDEENKLVFRKNVLSEPNSAEMKDLIDEIKKHNIKVAFVEPQYISSVLSKIAKEHNIQIFTLDPLWKEIKSIWHIDNFKNNLDSLYNIYE